jgi:hypothetical protein
MRLFFRIILACGALALPGASLADNKFCYWNADGLPYSKAPPPDAEEPPVSGGPILALFVMHMEAPHLALKSACGLIEDADLARPREVYRMWGCSDESSMAQMIEGLAHGGVFVSTGMSFLDYAREKHGAEFAENCRLLKDIDPICFRLVDALPKDAEQNPQCVDAWPRIKMFGKFLSEIGERDKALASDLSQKDRALIESAGAN